MHDHSATDPLRRDALNGRRVAETVSGADPDPAPGEFDAIAELFLDDADPPRPEESATPRTHVGPRSSPIAADPAPPPGSPAGPPDRGVEIEAVILGHLPVLAGAWVPSYAKAAADRQGRPAALVRVRERLVTVELVGAGATPAPPAPTLDSAIAAAAAGRWLIQVDEAAEPALLNAPGLGCITLLTAADEAAIVASYRTLKQLARRAEADPTLACPLGVAVLGSPVDRADEAAAKIVRAAQAFLAFRPGVAAIIPRIEATRVSTMYRGPAPASISDLIATIAACSRRHADAGQAHTHPADPRDDQPAPEPADSHGNPADEAAAAPLSGLPSPAPEPGTSSAAPERSLAAAGSLASLLHGLAVLAPRSPDAPAVELAADADGVVHALSLASEPGDEPGALGSLVAAGAWCSRHAELLAMACPTAGLDRSARPVLHLFTTRAKLARPLIDGEVRLHLLTDTGGVRAAHDLN